MTRPLVDISSAFWQARPDDWQRQDIFRVFLIGADHKTRWVFGGDDSPVRLHRPPSGLQGAPVEHDYQDIVGMDGGLYQGTMDARNTISLQVWVSDPRSSAWARRQHSLWRESLGRGKETCRLYVVTKESGYWWIDVRLESISDVNYFDQKPGALNETGELVTFTTDRSYWQRFEEVRTFDRATCRQAGLLNLGDQPAWLRWAITGTHNGVEIGVGSDTHTLPNPSSIAGGNPVSGYYIDTDHVWPALMSSDGRDLLPKFPNAFWKKPLPPRGEQRGRFTPLTINPINPGPDFRVDVAYTPRAEQAW